MSNTQTASYEKLRLAIRYWLLGRGYTTALKAMEFAASYHTGLRKNGEPEFSHQVWQVHYLRTLERDLLHPEATLAVVFLHDTLEDYPVKVAELESLFGAQIADSTALMSKVLEGEKLDASTYFRQLGQDPIASVAKGVDRTHNHKTMIGAFSLEKQGRYLEETTDDIMPMLKIARRLFPAQEPVYENIKHMLVSQMELLAYAHAQSA